jgi:hypothetical protein
VDHASAFVNAGDAALDARGREGKGSGAEFGEGVGSHEGFGEVEPGLGRGRRGEGVVKRFERGEDIRGDARDGLADDACGKDEG